MPRENSLSIDVAYRLPFPLSVANTEMHKLIKIFQKSTERLFLFTSLHNIQGPSPVSVYVRLCMLLAVTICNDFKCEKCRLIRLLPIRILNVVYFFF